MHHQTSHFYEFGPFRLDVADKQFLRNQEPVPLTPKAFETLLVLVRRSGHLVEKDELLKEVWADSFVEEGNLTQNIYMLRKVLGEQPDGRSYIETVPRRGYRFVADVREGADAETELIIRQQSRAHIVIEEEDTDDEQTPVATPAATTHLALPAPVRRKSSRYFVFSFVAIAAVLSVASGVYLWNTRRASEPVVANPVGKSIAVLPFNQLGAGADDELLGFGMADATIIKLSSLQKLRVMPTSTVYSYTERGGDPIQIGRELGVDTVLGGTVQRADGRVRVTLQLINVADGRTLWSGKFDERFTDIFNVQDSISEQVARALSLQITDDAKELLAKRPTWDTEAYQAYLMGIYHWNKRTKESLQKAVEYFGQAVEQDPKYARAYAVMADAYALTALSHESDPARRKAAWERAKSAATRAIEIDPDTAEAHTALALIKTAYQRDFPGAAQSHERALRLNPSYAIGRVRHAWFLINSGKLEEGVSEMRRGQELDPLSPITNAALGNVLYLSRRYDDSIRYCRRAIELEPDNSPAHFNLGESYAMKGMYREAANEFRQARGIYADSTTALEATAIAYALAGQEAEARNVLADVLKSASSKEVMPINVAMIYGALGEKDAAFEWLNRTNAGEVSTLVLRYDPMLDSLRSDARFMDYLRRANISYPYEPSP